MKVWVTAATVVRDAWNVETGRFVPFDGKVIGFVEDIVVVVVVSVVAGVGERVVFVDGKFVENLSTGIVVVVAAAAAAAAAVLVEVVVIVAAVVVVVGSVVETVDVVGRGVPVLEIVIVVVEENSL